MNELEGKLKPNLRFLPPMKSYMGVVASPPVKSLLPGNFEITIGRLSDNKFQMFLVMEVKKKLKLP